MMPVTLPGIMLFIAGFPGLISCPGSVFIFFTPLSAMANRLFSGKPGKKRAYCQQIINIMAEIPVGYIYCLSVGINMGDQ